MLAISRGTIGLQMKDQSFVTIPGGSNQERGGLTHALLQQLFVVFCTLGDMCVCVSGRGRGMPLPGSCYSSMSVSCSPPPPTNPRSSSLTFSLRGPKRLDTQRLPTRVCARISRRFGRMFRCVGCFRVLQKYGNGSDTHVQQYAKAGRVHAVITGPSIFLRRPKLFARLEINVPHAGGRFVLGETSLSSGMPTLQNLVHTYNAPRARSTSTFLVC